MRSGESGVDRIVPIARISVTLKLSAAIAAMEAPFRKPAGRLDAIREGLYDCMWDDAGIMRTEAGLLRARARLTELSEALTATGVADGQRGFNVTWHDWLNLRSLIDVSRVIVEAALSREDSRGAHFRDDFPATGDLPSSSFTVVRQRNGELDITRSPVQFTRVAPGQTILEDAA